MSKIPAGNETAKQIPAGNQPAAHIYADRDYERGYLQALRDLATHITFEKERACLIRDDSEVHSELLDFLHGLMAQKEKRLGADGSTPPAHR